MIQKLTDHARLAYSYIVTEYEADYYGYLVSHLLACIHIYNALTYQPDSSKVNYFIYKVTLIASFVWCVLFPYSYHPLLYATTPTFLHADLSEVATKVMSSMDKDSDFLY